MMGANLLVAKFLLPFEQLVGGWRQWVFALAALQRVRTVLAEHPPRLAGSSGEAHGTLVVKDLVYAPPGCARPVLNGISLQVEPGEVLAVTGSSAAGKSTLARLMVGLFPPTDGGVQVDGIDAARWDRAALGRIVGYVPQSVALLDGTIFDNIARMADADSHAVVAAATRAGVHDMIGRLPRGYATWVGSNGYVLSGGQRQRIALARALFGDPKLIVLDEPDAHLDHVGEQSLADIVADLKRGGTGVVVVTHRPGLLSVADRVLVLKQGRVYFCGAPSALSSDGLEAAPSVGLGQAG
jgi:ATP-binding cassette subfamily C protein